MTDRLSKHPLALAALALVAALIGAGAFWLVQRAVPSSLGTADRARVERVVRDYVLAHPEIIPEAMDLLRARETGKVIDANADAILKPFHAAWAGNPDGDVTVVEYFDYNCGYCRASLPNVAQLIASDPKVKIVYRELPILAESSATAARFSLAAAEQGKFTAFHDALYAAGQVTDATIAAAARTAGVDLRRAAATAFCSSSSDRTEETTWLPMTKLGVPVMPSWRMIARLLAISASARGVKAAARRRSTPAVRAAAAIVVSVTWPAA